MVTITLSCLEQLSETKNFLLGANAFGFIMREYIYNEKIHIDTEITHL